MASFTYEPTRITLTHSRVVLYHICLGPVILMPQNMKSSAVKGRKLIT